MADSIGSASLTRLCNCLFTLLIFLYLVVIAYGDGTVSLAQLTAYSIQRYCVQECIWLGPTDGEAPLPAHLSCPLPYSNNCLCRTDLNAPASSFLTSYVDKWCSGNTVDLSNAVSLYTGYCNNDLSTIL
jgi:hypothetical protein